MSDTDLRTAALNGGLYTISNAARILATSNIKLRSWVEGYPNSLAAPILHTRLVGRRQQPLLTFLDFIEAAWVAHFINLGYSPQTVRKVSNKLRDRTNFPHPFALKSAFLADGKEIFEETVDDEGERRLVNLMNDNFTMKPMVKKSLFDRIFYVEDVAAAYRPSDHWELVIMNPKISNGRPVVENRWVPTRTLYDAYCAEEGDEEAVADEYAVSIEEVRNAVGFERGLREHVAH